MIDFLDAMAWDIVIGAALIGVAAIRLPYKAATDSVEEQGKTQRLGFAIAIGASGLFLFLSGLALNFLGLYATHYNVLFGGAASIGGLALLATSAALFLNAGLKPVSYFAVIVGLYLVLDAYAIMFYGLTRADGRTLAFLAYLASGVASILSPIATHSDNKYMRWIFAIFAFLFALGWLVEAGLFTWGHLKPPPPA